jgi:two-component system, NarL family, nitrate/nitrite response regulator NarL
LLLAGQTRMTAPRIRVFIADTHPIFRDGLGRLLQTDPRLIVAGHTSMLADTVALVRETRADVLLLGIDAAGDCLETLTALRSADVPVRTILLVDRVERADVRSALELGVRAVLPKDSPADRLFSVIVEVMSEALSTDLRQLAGTLRRTQAFSLTPRETEILSAIAAGASNKDIAKKFQISENTVKSHIGHLFNKLGASNRLELAVFAKHHRLLDGV